MRTARLVLVLAVVAGLGAAVAIWARWSGRASPPRVSFRTGARQAYVLRVESTLRFAGGAANGPRTIRQNVAGMLHLRVLDPGSEGARVAFQLAGASLTLAGASNEALDRQLGRVFVATFADDGALVRFEFSSAVGEEVRTLIQETVRTFEVIVPRGAGTEWTAEEQHASGRYRAAYRLTTDGRILKSKVAYLDEAGGAGTLGGMRVSIRRAQATIRIDPAASWLERMVDGEELAVSLGEGLFTASSLRAEVARVPWDPAAPSELEIDEAPGSYREVSAALANAGPPPPSRSRALPAPEPRGLDALVRALDTSESTGVGLLYELRDLLLRDPTAAGRVLALLRDGVEDATAAALLNALGMAATEEALAALRTVVEEPAFGRMNQARAALALGGASVIDDESLAALRDLADGERAEGLVDTAVLSLGMAGDTLRRGGSQLYSELRDDLVRRLDAARDGPGAASALLALGNTHDPALAGAVAAGLEDASPAARSAAAHALGKLGAGAQPDLLAQRLALEEDGAVRAEIAASLNALSPPSGAVLALVNEAVTRERDSQARYEMARLLGENLATYPEARTTLAALSKQDPSRRIREYATHVVWGAQR